MVNDFGENVILSEGLVLQEQKSWEQLIETHTVTGNASELFFFLMVNMAVKNWLREISLRFL